MTATIHVNAEKMTMLLIAVIFIGTSLNLLKVSGGPITREEAITISQETELFKETAKSADSFSALANFYNSSMVDKFREEGPNAFLFQEMPTGHGAWTVDWGFSYNDTPGQDTIVVIIDAETGAITHSERGLEFL